MTGGGGRLGLPFTRRDPDSVFRSRLATLETAVSAPTKLLQAVRVFAVLHHPLDALDL